MMSHQTNQQRKKMHQGIRSLSALALGLALTCTVANAQLLLSGWTTGSFDDLAEPNTTVVNAADGSAASFHTGIPYHSTQSKIEFVNSSFTDVGSGNPLQVGLFTITNGMTLLGSAAETASFNLGLQLTSPVWQTVAITPILFHIDNTPNGAIGVPDSFSVSFSQPAPIHIQNFLVQFHVNVTPLDFLVPENATVKKGDITVTFTPITPVPEPATYALWGSALLVGFVAYRRVRGGQDLRSLPVAV
jgi:hypothetical protein